MSKGNLEVISKGHAERVERIVGYVDCCKKTVGDLAAYKYIAGAELIALKADCQHGEFEKLKDGIFKAKGISRSAIGRFMQFAEKVHTKYPKVGYLHPEKFLTEGKVDHRGREKVVEFFHEETDGKSMTEFCRDIGAIREKKPAQHHPRKTTTPEEKVSGEKEQARGVMNACLTPIATFMLDPGATLVNLSRAERQQFLAGLVNATTAIREFQPKKP